MYEQQGPCYVSGQDTWLRIAIVSIRKPKYYEVYITLFPMVSLLARLVLTDPCPEADTGGGRGAQGGFLRK